MEKRNANVMFGKAGGNASKNAYTCRISLPKTWLDRMGVSIDKREVTLSLDDDRIIIEKSDRTGIKKVPLANKKKIRCFALVWQQMYKNHASIPGSFFDDVEFVGEGLANLGFEMDAGESLKRAFPGVDAFQDNAALQRIIEQLDIQTLGNAIFSQWRYWNHWSDYNYMEEPDYEWFVIAFSRLAELTK